MAFRLKRSETVADGIRRIVCEQADSSVSELTGGEMDIHEAVHVVRKRLKKIRAALRLVRDPLGDVYPGENVWFRDAGRRLSAARDAEAMIETFDRLRGAYEADMAGEGIDDVRAALVARRDRIAHEEADLTERVRALADDLLRARERAGEWPLSVERFGGLRRGLERTYRRGRKAMTAARQDGTGENYHEWRKRVKYLWYQIRILCRVWRKPMRALRKELHRLSDLLGEDHDLVVFGQLLEEQGESLAGAREREVLRDVVERSQRHLRRSAHDLSRRIYAETPSAFCRRLAAYWEAWRG